MEIYTDGACSKNGQIDSVGGYGFVVVLNNEIIYKECGRTPYKKNTNQVSELFAILKATEFIIKKKTTFSVMENFILHTDSAYSINCLTVWHKNWINNGWRNSKKEEVANKDLIIKILNNLDTIKENYYFTFKKVAGHCGILYNEKADELARQGAKLDFI